MKKNKVAILIPALNPNQELYKIIKELKDNNINNIWIVNDGSKKECNKIFTDLKNEYNINLIINSKNLGKGASLKKGIEEIQKDNNIDGIITMDCDGQHKVSDALNVMAHMKDEIVVFGTRDFKNKNVPFRNKFGNRFSSLYMKLLTGKFIKDTQTGLRGIPRKYFDLALNVHGSRFEYEMNFLYKLCKKKIYIEYIDISTIYENNGSEFRVIKDSIIIYQDVIKNIIASLISVIIDIFIFYVLSQYLYVFWANSLARVVSGGCDYTLNKYWVFKHQKETKKQFRRYLILFIGNLLVNSLILTGLSYIFENLLVLKVIINTLMYIVNFFLKKKYVF